MSMTRAAAALKSAPSVTVTTHINPDGDGIGAALALMHAFEGQGKKVRFLCPSPVASLYKFLPGFERIKVVESEAEARKLAPAPVLVSCDCGDRKRLGAVASVPHSALINLDHHSSNDRFGTINVVLVRAASTGIVVDALLRRLCIAITAPIATCLYTTVVFDTGRFMHSNTTAAVLRQAARFLSTGIDASAINRALTYTRTPVDLAVQRLGIDRLRVDRKDSRLAGIALSAADIAGLGETVEDWGELIELPRSLRGVEVAYLLRENADCASARVSLRSNPPWAVGPVAHAFGGGGHLQAAGATFPGNLAAAEKKIVAQLRAVLTQ